MKCKCFPPAIDRRSSILILGSFPGERSLQANQYYAHAQNQFWPILEEVLGCPFPKDYKQKLETLRKNGVGLWDVAESCKRQGSADHKIVQVCPNDIGGLLKKYPNIKSVFCNGKKSHHLLRKYFPQIKAEVLPSTSPAYTIPLKRKLRKWRGINCCKPQATSHGFRPQLM